MRPYYTRVVIFGTRDLAELAQFYFEHYGLGKPVAFCVDGEYLKETSFKGLPVVALEEIGAQFKTSDSVFFVPMTHKGMGDVRKNKLGQIKNMGYKVCNLISPDAIVLGQVLGVNNFIFENNVIQPFTTIGDNNIIWSGNHIGHHSKILDNNFITSHVVISGHVTVTDGCYLGVNSTIRDGITIAPKTIVGMGAVIGGDTESNRVYTNPNTPFRKNYDKSPVLSEEII